MSRSDRPARRRTAVLGAAGALVGSVAVAAPAAPPPSCLDVLVSPAYRRDRTLWCVYRDAGDDTFTVSTDRGRRWRHPAMAGLVRPAGLAGASMSVTVSPAYAADRSLFATTESGTFVRRDLGETFTPVDATTRPGERNPVAFVGHTSAFALVGSAARRVLLAYASTRLPALIDPAAGTHLPVTGVPGRGALRFVVPPSPDAPAGALAVVNEADAGAAQSEHASVFRCDARLTCAEPLFSFPAGIRFGVNSRMVVHADGSVVAVLAAGDASQRIWRSTDGGVTFTEWRSVARLVAPLRAGGHDPRAWFATSPAAPRRVYLRVELGPSPSGWPKNGTPASQLFRSDDSGSTWRRVAYARGIGQRGTHGNLPWLFGGPGGVHLTPDGRLFADGGDDTLDTTWCSLDGGVRWSAGCPR